MKYKGRVKNGPLKSRVTALMLHKLLVFHVSQAIPRSTNNVNTLNSNPNNLRHIFIYSTQYRGRFGPQFCNLANRVAPIEHNFRGVRSVQIPGLFIVSQPGSNDSSLCYSPIRFRGVTLGHADRADLDCDVVVAG